MIGKNVEQDVIGVLIFANTCSIDFPSKCVNMANTVHVLKFLTTFLPVLQINCWLTRLEFAKCMSE